MSYLLRVPTESTSPETTDTDAERRARTALARAQAEMTWADEVFSTFKPQSPMSRLRRGEIELEEAPPEVAEVLELSRLVREVTDGWFDPWSMPGGVDPTGIVKGWAAQRALAVLKTSGVPGALINAGGDIGVYGHPEDGQAWRIAVRDHVSAERSLITVEIDGDGAVATSGNYERGAHLLDPKRGRPATRLASATVIGRDLAFSDALATAVFVSDGRLLDRIGTLRGYHALVVDVEGVVRASAGFPLTLPAPAEPMAASA